MVGNLVDAVGRDIGDNDALFSGDIDINVVESNAVTRDNLTLLSGYDNRLADWIPARKDSVHHRCKG